MTSSPRMRAWSQSMGIDDILRLLSMFYYIYLKCWIWRRGNTPASVRPCSSIASKNQSWYLTTKERLFPGLYAVQGHFRTKSELLYHLVVRVLMWLNNGHSLVEGTKSILFIWRNEVEFSYFLSCWVVEVYLHFRTTFFYESCKQNWMWMMNILLSIFLEYVFVRGKG